MFRRQIDIIRDIDAPFQCVQFRFKGGVGYIVHDPAQHIQQSPVGIVRKAWIVRGRGQSHDRIGIQSDVEDRVHHARHGNRGAAPTRNQ